VAVAGEVKRPAIYEVVTGTRLADVVTLAGGVTPTSYLKRVQIVRALPNAERVTLDVDLTSHYLKGEETSNPRWPLPMGATMSMTRPVMFSSALMSRSRAPVGAAA